MCKYTERLGTDMSKDVGGRTVFETEVWNELLYLSFALKCKEKENQACVGVFSFLFFSMM